jgi:hypothetical protein
MDRYLPLDLYNKVNWSYCAPPHDNSTDWTGALEANTGYNIATYDRVVKTQKLSGFFSFLLTIEEEEVYDKSDKKK